MNNSRVAQTVDSVRPNDHRVPQQSGEPLPEYSRVTNIVVSNCVVTIN